MKYLLPILFISTLFSCSKDEEIPTLYQVHVVDEFTREPIVGAIVLLQECRWPALYDYDTIGVTDNNGNFEYLVEQAPIHNDSYYKYYSLVFIKENHSTAEVYLAKNNKTNMVTVDLNKAAVFGLMVRRITPETSCPFQTYNLWFDISTVAICYNCSFNPDSSSLTTFYPYFRFVPSNQNTRVSWRTVYQDTCGGSVSTNWVFQDVFVPYGDTTFYYLDY